MISGKIYVIDKKKNISTLATLPAQPSSLGVSPDGSTLFATDYNNQSGGNLYTINTKNGQITQYVSNPNNPTPLLVFGSILPLSNTEVLVVNNTVSQSAVNVQILDLTLNQPAVGQFNAVAYSQSLTLNVNQGASGLTLALSDDQTQSYYATTIQVNTNGDSTVYVVPVGSSGGALTPLALAGMTPQEINNANFIDLAYVPPTRNSASGYLYVMDNGDQGGAGNHYLWQGYISTVNSVLTLTMTAQYGNNLVLPFALAYTQNKAKTRLTFYFGNYGNLYGQSEVDALIQS